MTTQIINATMPAMTQSALSRLIPGVAQAAQNVAPIAAAVAAPVLSEGLAKMVSNPLEAVTGPLLPSAPAAPSTSSLSAAERFALSMMDRAEPGSAAQFQKALTHKRTREETIEQLIDASIASGKKHKKDKKDDADWTGINDLEKLQQLQKQKELDQQADRIRIMLPKMAKNPLFKQDLEESGMMSKLSASSVQALDTAEVFRLQQNVMLALNTELDTSPITTGINFLSQMVELGSLYAYQNYGWVPLLGLSEDIKNDPDIMKNAQKLAYEWMSFATMDPKTTLLLSLPAKLMKRYATNKQGLNDESKDVEVPAEVVDHFKDL